MVRKKYTTTKTVKGHVYQYFRKNGKYIKLPDDPNSEKYDQAYWAALRGKSQPSKRHTWNKLIISYKEGPRWEKLAPRTKSDYNKVLQYLKDIIGDLDVTKMRRSHIIDAQLANKHRARFANYIPHMLSILFEHAINLDWPVTNRAKGVEKLKTGDGHKPWPEPLIERFVAEADPMTALLVELAIGTGQRVGDLLQMKWADIDGDEIHVIQNKTQTELWIPFTQRLQSVLDKTPKVGFYILTNTRGQQLSYNVAESRFRRTRAKVNGVGYTIHGLRYYAAHQLAEAGCTDAQIAAITGHKSAEMVAKYSRKASQRSLARAAQKMRQQ